MHLNFLDTALCLRVAETLLHFLWQGFAIGLAVWMINACVAQGKSNLRYRLNLFALLLMAACLPLTFAVLTTHEPTLPRVAETAPAMPENARQMGENESTPVETMVPVEIPAASAPGVTPQPSELIVEDNIDETETPVVTSNTEKSKVAGTVAIPWMSRIAPYATATYVLGVMVMLLRLLLAVWGGQRLRRTSQVIDEPGLLARVEQLARRLGLKVAPVVATCGRISGPVVVGILKPMILLPPMLVSSMSPAQLEAVLAHEIAHLRQFDLFVNLLQRLIEAVLFFHPAVWYVSRRVSLERENSCDDLVMEHGCDRLTYADALLRMAEICTDGSRQPGLESAAALAATGSQPSEFKSRLLRVVGETDGPPLRLTRWGLALFAAMLISITALLWVMHIRAAGSTEIDWKSVRVSSYERDGKVVSACYSDQEIIYALIATAPDGHTGLTSRTEVQGDPERGNLLHMVEFKWDSTWLIGQIRAADSNVVQFAGFENSKKSLDRQYSLQDGRLFYCDFSTRTFEQRKTLKGSLPPPPLIRDAKIADAVAKMVHRIESQFAPHSPALDLSGSITDARFIDTVAGEVARLPFATSWQSENARQFARQITREHLSPDMPEEERRRILESLHEHVTSFLDSHRGESDDSAYCRRPEDVRNLLWRLKLALVRMTLDEPSQTQLDAQVQELCEWVRSVPLHPQSKLTHEAVISKLKKRQDDPLEPLFKAPLPEEAFEQMMSKLRKKVSSSVHAEHHAVAEWFYAQVESSPGVVRLTDDPAEKNVSRGTSNAEVRVGYQSTAVWLGNRNGTDAWSTFIDLSEDIPGIRSLDPPRSVIQQGDDAVREWVEASSYDNLGHITFDFKKRRLVAVRGTRLLTLDVESYIAADRLNGDLLKQQIREKGLNEFSLPEPKGVDELGHDETYDQFVGVLTKHGKLYVLKVETVGTLSRMMWYHARLHNPPHPDEAAFAENHGSHDHDHSELTPEAQMKEVIGRFDPAYWKTVDVPRLIADKQIAFSPDREVLALLRGQMLYAIESVSGHFQEYEVQEKTDLVEWKSGSIHVVTESGNNQFYAVRRPVIQFLDDNGDPTSAGRLMEARIGFAAPRSDWMMYSKPGRPMSLMGLKPGTHWLVTDSRDLFAVSMPLGSRDPNLPPEVSLQGEVTERKTLSGTVREVRRRLQPQPTFQADNVSATASVKPLGNGRELLFIEIQNNSGKRLQFSEQHVYLETEVEGRYERALSPNWTQEVSDSKWPHITIEDGAKGVMELDWNRWRDRGLWHRGFVVTSDTKGLGPIEKIPGTLQVRVYGPGFRTRPVALSIPETEEPAERQPEARPNPQSNDGVQAPPGDPIPIDATTLELYNRYIASVGKIETRSIDAAIELVAARSSGDPEFRKRLRKDFATSCEEEDQNVSPKLLALITKILHRDGGMRWQREEEQRSGIPGQRALPQRGPLRLGDEVNRESPLLADVIKYGRQCDRHELSAFVFAVRQAHHPQGTQFLLDVLNEPTNTVESSPGSDEPDPIDSTKSSTIPEKSVGDVEDKTAKRKWPFAPRTTSRFIAAVGLAELGVEDGIRWLIENAKPNDFGDGGTVWHHFHVRNGASGGLRANCKAALHDLSGVRAQGEENPIDWEKWWRQNKKSFTPRHVALKETPGG